MRDYRALVVFVCVVVSLGWVTPVVATADPTPSPKASGLSDIEAMRQARSSGERVVATSLTDERTLVTADPETGLFEAELTAGVARVRDGAAGWREPSTGLVQGSDGLWRPEAAVTELAISPGGSSDAPVASISDGAVSVRFGWPERLPQAVVEGATATYPEVFAGVDLVVKAGLESVETFLVVKTREASLNPAVRSWSMPMTTSPGLTAKTLDNGAKSLVDGVGTEQVHIPAALMWDSSGKDGAVTGAEERIAEVAETRVAPVTTQLAAKRLTAVPQASFLDDPATVYPVVIDPSANLGQTHVLRVTDDWSKWDGAVGDHGKVGYNGWSSPYYRSRMFYQFAWVKSAGTYVAPKQIIKAEFQYRQDHSPQHSPCNSTSGTYPGVYAKLANTINSSDTWSDRTGSAWHPWPSVLSRLAVGSEDTCNKIETQKWNMTQAVVSERQPQSQGGYDYRTTITIGLLSDDEGDKMGWKHYLNDGSSPKFVITYHGAPQVPNVADFGVTPKVAGVSSPLVTTSKTPTLSTKVKLEGDYTCPAADLNCVRAEFELVTGSTTRTVVGAPTTSGGTSTAPVTTALTPGTYTVRSRTFSLVSDQASAWSAPITMSVEPTPSAPTWSWDTTGWTNPPTIPANTPLTINAAKGNAADVVKRFCATITGGAAGPTVVCSSDGGAQIIIPAGLPQGTYTVSVTASAEYTTGPAKADNPVQRQVSGW